MKENTLLQYLRRFPLPSLLLSGIVALMYSPSLRNAYAYDDYGSILLNTFNQDIGNIRHFLDQDFFKSGELNYRPFAVLDWMIGARYFQENPFAQHLISILLHVLASVLFYGILRQILERRGFGGEAGIWAWLAGFLFALHPAVTEAVCCASFRKDIWAAFFCLVSLWLLFVSADFPSLLKRCFGILAVLSFALGLASKETALVAPLAFLPVYMLRFKDKSSGEKPDSFALTLLLLPFVTFIALRFFLMVPENNYVSNLSLFDRLAIMPQVFTHYMSVMICPVFLSADPIPVFLNPFSVSLFSAWAYFMGGLLLWILLIALIFYFRKRDMFPSLGLYWFLLFLLPVSNVFPLVNPAAERYLYWPSMGFSVATVFFLRALMKRGGNFWWAGCVAGALVFMFIPIANMSRQKAWKDEKTLWLTTLDNHPDSLRAHMSLGKYYEREKLWEVAQIHYLKACELGPQNARMFFDAGRALFYNKQFAESLDYYERSKELGHDAFEVDLNTGSSLFFMDRKDEAEGIWRRMRETFKGDPRVKSVERNIRASQAEGYKVRAAALKKAGDNTGAINELNLALAVFKEDPTPFAEIGFIYEEMNLFDKAVSSWRRYLEEVERLNFEISKAEKKGILEKISDVEKKRKAPKR